MAVNNVLQTYGDSSIVTDIVRDAVEYISAKESGIYSLLEKTKALQMVHSFMTDTYQGFQSNAVEQGADFAFNSRTTPTLLTNIVEEVAIGVRVTRPQVASQHYTGQNELDRQMAKGLVEWTNSVEYDLVRGTLTSGTSGTVATMSKLVQTFVDIIFMVQSGIWRNLANAQIVALA